MTFMSFILGFGTGFGTCFVLLFLVSLSMRPKKSPTVEELRDRINELSKNNIKQPL